MFTATVHDRLHLEGDVGVMHCLKVRDVYLCDMARFMYFLMQAFMPSMSARMHVEATEHRSGAVHAHGCSSRPDRRAGAVVLKGMSSMVTRLHAFDGHLSQCARVS
jgi:hypothetical protein